MNTPTLRFKEFSGAWEVKRINEITSYVDYRGKTPEKSDAGVFLVTAKNIRFGYIDYETSKEYIPNDAYEDVMRRGKPLIGDVLITTEAPCGNVASVDRDDVALAQRVIKFRGKKELIQNYFLKFYLLSDVFQKSLLEKASGGTVKGIKGSVLHKMQVQFPTLPEQTKIANFLTAIDEKIAQLSQTAQLLTDYKKGVMQQIFSQQLRFKDDDGREFAEWEEFPLSALGEFKNGINKSKEDFGFGYPFVNLMDVFGKPSIKNEDFGLVNVSENEINSYNLLKGDVIFIRSSVKLEGVGETSVVLEDLKNTVYSGFLIRFREYQNKLDLLYKKYCFHHVEFRNQLLSVSTTSANTNINQESLNQLVLRIPSLPEQTKIANFLTAIDDKITHNQTQLDAMKQYKSGLLQQMFV